MTVKRIRSYCFTSNCREIDSLKFDAKRFNRIRSMFWVIDQKCFLDFMLSEEQREIDQNFFEQRLQASIKSLHPYAIRWRFLNFYVFLKLTILSDLYWPLWQYRQYWPLINGWVIRPRQIHHYPFPFSIISVSF